MVDASADVALISRAIDTPDIPAATNALPLMMAGRLRQERGRGDSARGRARRIVDAADELQIRTSGCDYGSGQLFTENVIDVSAPSTARRLVGQVRPHPPFDLLDRLTLAARIAGNLILADPPHREVLRLRVREIKTA